MKKEKYPVVDGTAISVEQKAINLFFARLLS